MNRTSTKIFLLAFFNLLAIASWGQKSKPKTATNNLSQSIVNKQITIPYTNGKEVFSVCATHCATSFVEKDKYYWYTPFSKIKSTNGGAGGDLLHGNYKFYDQEGNLRQDRNFFLGRLDGSEKTWDSLGSITSQLRYVKGQVVYWKFKNDEGYTVEHIGPMLHPGSIKRAYSKYNALLSERTYLPDFKSHVKLFYEDAKSTLKEEYTTDGFSDDYMIGKYTSYFENGKVKVEGQFYNGKLTNIKVGTWKWFNADGTLNASEQYKEHIELWPNGEKKAVGMYYLLEETKTWVKDGSWRWYTEEGKWQASKEYKLGEEVKGE